MATVEAPASPTSSSPSPIIIRELTPAEFHLLAGVGLFEIFAIPDMRHTIPIVAQDQNSGKIVGYWLIFDAVHVEPLWIDPDHRKKPGLARRLWKAVQETLIAREVPIAFACIADNDAATNLPQATRLGFQRIPGSLFFIEVKPEGEAAKDWKPAKDQVLEILRRSNVGGGDEPPQ